MSYYPGGWGGVAMGWLPRYTQQGSLGCKQDESGGGEVMNASMQKPGFWSFQTHQPQHRFLALWCWQAQEPRDQVRT